jgi:hypothetical protein
VRACNQLNIEHQRCRAVPQQDSFGAQNDKIPLLISTAVTFQHPKSLFGRGEALLAAGSTEPAAVPTKKLP